MHAQTHGRIIFTSTAYTHTQHNNKIQSGKNTSTTNASDVPRIISRVINEQRLRRRKTTTTTSKTQPTSTIYTLGRQRRSRRRCGGDDGRCVVAYDVVYRCARMRYVQRTRPASHLITYGGSIQKYVFERCVHGMSARTRSAAQTPS